MLVFLLALIIFHSLCDGHCDVVYGEPSFQEEVLSHVREGWGGVDRVSTDTVPLEIRGGVATLELEIIRFRRAFDYQVKVRQKISFLKKFVQKREIGVMEGKFS